MQYISKEKVDLVLILFFKLRKLNADNIPEITNATNSGSGRVLINNKHKISIFF